MSCNHFFRTLLVLLALLAAGVGAWAQTPVTLSIDSDIPSGTPGHYYVNMPDTSSASLSIPGGITSFAIYDDGGKDGDYTSNCDGTLTLTAPLNCVLQISGNLSGSDPFRLSADQQLYLERKEENSEHSDHGLLLRRRHSLEENMSMERICGRSGTFFYSGFFRRTLFYPRTC